MAEAGRHSAGLTDVPSVGQTALNKWKAVLGGTHVNDRDAVRPMFFMSCISKLFGVKASNHCWLHEADVSFSSRLSLFDAAFWQTACRVYFRPQQSAGEDCWQQFENTLYQSPSNKHLLIDSKAFINVYKVPFNINMAS